MTATPELNPLGLLLYCRPGFEKECSAEIIHQAGLGGVHGYVSAAENSGFVRFFPQKGGGLKELQRNLRFSDLIFARQWVCILGWLENLPAEDRLTPLMALIQGCHSRFSELLLETADTNDAKALSVFLRKFAVPLRLALEREQLLGYGYQPRLHVFFLSATSVCVGYTDPNNASPWLMGIPRLKLPRGAPSRSTLKLDEAFQVFVHQPDFALRPAMTAVDLGAAPGGWTFQLVKRHIRTIAVDNGPLDPALLESGIVEHLRVDGFRYRPAKPVDWLVCDMVEQPARIAALVAEWLGHGWCRQAIFNLKLPMKKRYESVLECRALMEARLARCEFHYRLEFRQLYHDRAEITGYIVRLDT
jgi:23S rRNA (cytidine2498-2'-O)-methyltransferase